MSAEKWQHPNGLLCPACGADEHMKGCPIATLQRELEAVRKERDALREAIEGIRCNTEPNATASYCDLPEETEPHSREQHLEAMFRAVNAWCRAALSQPVQPVEDAPIQRRPMSSSWTAFEGPSSEPVEDAGDDAWATYSRER